MLARAAASQLNAVDEPLARMALQEAWSGTSSHSPKGRSDQAMTMEMTTDTHTPQSGPC